jgi:predicted small lipoprotein YifL
MRRALSLLAALTTLSVMTACGGDGGSGPEIDAIAPASGARGAAVTITGVRFCGDGDDAAGADGACTTPPAGFVNFGVDADVARATVTSWRHEEIVVSVPQAVVDGTNQVIVTVNGVSSNAAEFAVVP